MASYDPVKIINIGKPLPAATTAESVLAESGRANVLVAVISDGKAHDIRTQDRLSQIIAGAQAAGQTVTFYTLSENALGACQPNIRPRSNSPTVMQ